MFDTFDDLVGTSDNSLDTFDLQISIGSYDSDSTSSIDYMDVKIPLKSFVILNNSGEVETVKSKRFKKPSLIQTTDFFGIEFEDTSYENRITRVRFEDILLVQRQWDYVINFYFGKAPSMSVWDTLNDEFRNITPANNDTPFRLCHYLQCAVSSNEPTRAMLPSDIVQEKENTNMSSAFEYSQNVLDNDDETNKSPTVKNLDIIFEYVKNNLFELHEDTPNVFYYEKSIFLSAEEVKETSSRFSLVDSTDSLERYLQPAAAYQTSATQSRSKTQNALHADVEEEDDEDEVDDDNEEEEEEEEDEGFNRVVLDEDDNNQSNNTARQAQAEMQQQIEKLYNRWYKILPPKMKDLDPKIMHDILVLLEMNQLRAYQLFPEMIRVLLAARTPYEVGRAKLLVRALSEKPTLQLRNMRQVKDFLRAPLPSE